MAAPLEGGGGLWGRGLDGLAFIRYARMQLSCMRVRQRHVVYALGTCCRILTASKPAREARLWKRAEHPPLD